MGKPTVLIEVDAFLLTSKSAQEFLHQSVFMAQKLEDRFGGVSLKITGSESRRLRAEFRWKGSVVVDVCNWEESQNALGRILNASEHTISVHSPFHHFYPNSFCGWGDLKLEDVFDLAFLRIIEQQLARLNEMKLNIENRRMVRV